MKGDNVLGFYSFGGTVYVNLAIAEDPMRTGSTINHELTHQTVSYSTTYGFVQEVLRIGRESQFVATEHRARANTLHDLMLDACRLAHEATATYAGLVDYTGPQLRAQIDQLPQFYQDAYQVFDELLAGRGLEPLDRYRVARAVGARAFQTSLFEDWIPGELWRQANLRAYLADPRHRPNERLIDLLGALRAVSTGELTTWCGRYLRGEESIVLSPPVPSPIAGLDFHPLPPLARAQAHARKIAETVYPVHAGSLDLQTIGHGGRTEIALAPPGFSSVDVEPDDLEWSRSADFALVVRNAFDEPYADLSPLGEQRVPPHAAHVYLFRPDYPAARRHTVPTAELGHLLERIDPQRRLPLCLAGNWSWLPTAPAAAQHPIESLADQLHAWTRGRPVLMYTGGGWFGFTMNCVLLEPLGIPLHIHRMQTGVTWGLILLRSPGVAWLTVVHPMLISEWDRVGEAAYQQHALERDTPPTTFFPGGETDVMPVLAFLRVYKRMMMPEDRWRALASAMARDEAAAVPNMVDPYLHGTRYDDAS